MSVEPFSWSSIPGVPSLLSYIQGIADEDPRPGRFILTGSQNLLLLDRVSQSLAGRTRILHLYPFSLSELEERDPWNQEWQLVPAASRASGMGRDLHTTLHTGFFPRIHDRRLDPTSWLADYRTTYVEREEGRV